MAWRREVLRVHVAGSSVRDAVSGRPLQISGRVELPAGDFVVEVEWRGLAARIVRVVGNESDRGSDADAPIMFNGVDLRSLDLSSTEPARAIEPGQIRSAPIPFSADQKAPRDIGAVAKVRPSVVIAVEPDHALVRGLYDVSSAVRRNGGARRLRAWDKSGLRKPSVVESAAHWVSTADLGEMIGEVHHDDSFALDVPSGVTTPPS